MKFKDEVNEIRFDGELTARALTVEDLMKAEISIEAICDLKNRLTDEAEVNHLDQVLSLACTMLCELCDEIEIDPMRLSEYREKLFKDE